MSIHVRQPELYWTIPNAHCPNSRLPVLVYRNVLPEDLEVQSCKDLMESNNWMYDRSWTHDPKAHFHANTHECYAATKGSTTCLYGVGPLDDQSEGVVFEFKAGDIAVHAAGVSHRHLESSEDYEYMGLYPKESPRYNSFLCNDGPEGTKAKAEQARKVPIPAYDPIYGLEGPLPKIWNETAGQQSDLS